MGRKKDVPSITTKQRLDWLKRVDQGESVFSIATDEEVDWRTVKKHIERAQSERELKDERSHVLRDALKSHFDDLVGVVEMMLTEVNSQHRIDFSGDKEFLEKALRNHIPHSAIWRMQRKWNTHVDDIGIMREKIKEQLQANLTGDAGLTAINQSNGGALFRGMLTALMFDLDEKAQSRPGLDFSKGLKSDSRMDDLTVWSHDAIQFGKFSNRDKRKVETALRRISSEVRDRDEFITLKNLYKKLSNISSKLKEELMILKWKRIIPGRCRLCPM